MSLLQFKPAPMYILDEIDAALDLQHTQHIGQLFRNRFKGSQFIVVSLKEGLFTNANVLFKARFRDGTSVVEVRHSSGSSVLASLTVLSVRKGEAKTVCTKTRRIGKMHPAVEEERVRARERQEGLGVRVEQHWPSDRERSSHSVLSTRLLLGFQRADGLCCII